MPVKSLKIIKQGTVSWEAFEEPAPYIMAMKRLAGAGDGSTVTYIETDKKIIVDTGFENESDLSDENIKKNEKALKRSLKDMAIKPQDIDIVFLTHMHRDHFGNLGVFKHSEIVASEAASSIFPEARGAKDGEQIADGVQVMYTPGHTADHASLVLSTERLRYSKQSGNSGGSILGIGCVNIVVAGDAIISPGHYLMNTLWEQNPDIYSVEKGMDSMGRIIDIADFIVPGHGGLFHNARKPKA